MEYVNCVPQPNMGRGLQAVKYIPSGLPYCCYSRYMHLDKNEVDKFYQWKNGTRGYYASVSNYEGLIHPGILANDNLDKNPNSRIGVRSFIKDGKRIKEVWLFSLRAIPAGNFISVDYGKCYWIDYINNNYVSRGFTID